MESQIRQIGDERRALVAQLQSLLQGEKIRLGRANRLRDNWIEVFFDPCRGEGGTVDHLMTIFPTSRPAPDLKGLLCTLQSCEGRVPFVMHMMTDRRGQIIWRDLPEGEFQLSFEAPSVEKIQPPAAEKIVKGRLAGGQLSQGHNQKSDGTAPPILPLELRRSSLTNILSITVAAAALVVICLQLSGPHSPEVTPSDLVAANPESYISPEKSQRVTMSGAGFILRKHDRVPFQAAHPTPLKHQWLLHIANSANLVAVTDKTGKLSYELRQIDTEWGGENSRHEFLVIVTSDKMPAGWPERVGRPIELKGLFSRGELAELQVTALDPNDEVRDRDLKRMVRTALDRLFGTMNCNFEIFLYPSENQD